MFKILPYLISKTAVEWKEEGNTHYLNNELEEAIKCYSKAIELSPSDATYYGNRAQAYMKCKLYEKSIVNNFFSNKSCILNYFFYINLGRLRKGNTIGSKFYQSLFEIGKLSFSKREILASKKLFQYSLKIGAT